MTTKLLGAGVLGALLVFAAAGSATALDRHVQIDNNTSYIITEFYASSVGVDNWEEDILGQDVLQPGESVEVNIDDGTGYCKYDLRAVFEDGDEAIKGDVNVCEIATFSFTD